MKPEPTSRLMTEMTELATGMRANGTMDQPTFEKITMRRFDSAKSTTLPPISAVEIRAMREQAHMSQAVFAKHLNLTVGYISQLERGAKQPTGATLALLTVVQRKGIGALI